VLAFVPVLVAAPALAEPSNEAVKMARKRFQEGVAAVDAGNYEAARVAFQQAYALKPHPSVLRNLGQAELKTGRYLEAARHLSTFVRDTTYGTAPEREAAAKSLAQAETQVGRVLVQVDVQGADITIDGELAGRSPVSDPFYAPPGERLIRIQKEGYDPYETSQVIEAGRTTQLKIALDAPAAARPAASVSHDAGAPAAPTEVGEADGVGAPPSGPSPAASSTGTGRPVALLATGGAALVAAGVWIGFGIRGTSLQSQADELRVHVGSCAEDTPSCAELRDLNDRRAAANTVALVGAVATGVSAAAFGAAFFLWPKASRTVARTAWLPMLSPDRAGLELRGSF
jgi:hypothetical protein